MSAPTRVSSADTCTIATHATFLHRAALTGKHDTLVRRAHQMLNAALFLPYTMSDDVTAVTNKAQTPLRRSVSDLSNCCVYHKSTTNPQPVHNALSANCGSCLDYCALYKYSDLLTTSPQQIEVAELFGPTCISARQNRAVDRAGLVQMF